MWSYGVVVQTPCCEDPAGIGQTGKPVFVETLVAQFAVEAFDVRGLGGFSWSDEIDADTALVGSGG